MDTNRADRLTSRLRARDVMAHVDRTGVYECGIRVVLDTNVEALWDLDGAAGLDAEVLSDGVLIGFVPHIEGSEDFTDEQIVDHIATTRYDLEGLHPPTDRRAGAARSREAARPPAPPVSPAPPSSAVRRRRWTDFFRRGGR